MFKLSAKRNYDTSILKINKINKIMNNNWEKTGRSLG